jgi:hypothetical protein
VQVVRSPLFDSRHVTNCNDSHCDFLYVIKYSVGDKSELKKVCRSCYHNEDCFNNKEYILAIYSLEGNLIWERPPEVSI